VPVLLPALLKGFPGWSRWQVSLLPSVLAFSAGLSVLPVGWLVDRVEARIVMIGGALTSGVALLIASQSNSLYPMIGAYLLLGVGISAGTVLPGSFVLANWFTERRGIAMGIAIAGTTVGGMVMTLLAGHVIRLWDWRTAYLALAAPMIILVTPLVALTVRSRPPGAVKMSVAQAAETLEGFEVSAAMCTRSFWMIVIANFCFAFAAAGAAIHMVAYLEGIGYNSGGAAFAMSLIFGFAAIGKVLMGHLADRLTARKTLAFNFALQVVGLSLAFTASNIWLLGLFVVLFGLTLAPPLMLLPLVVAESLGLKRFGFLCGLTGLAQTVGAAVGPQASGWIYDSTNSYAAAFELFIIVNVIAAIVALSCLSYSAERSRMVPAAAPLSA